MFQAFPDGYELRSELRLGIDSVSDPAILPYDLDSYVSSSAEDDSDAPEGCKGHHRAAAFACSLARLPQTRV